MDNGFNLLAIYIANGTGIALMLILLFVSKTKFQRKRVEDRIYLIMCYGIILGCLCESIGFTVDGHIFPFSRAINYVVNMYLFSFNLLLTLLFTFYIDLGIYGNPERIKENYKFHTILAIALISLNIINLFVPIIYDISAENVYSRCPLGYIYYVAIVYYFVTAYRTEKNYEKKYGTRSFFSVYMFLIPISVGVGLQFLIYGISVAWLSCGVGLTGLYMMQQNEMAFIDSLVETYNRQYLDYVISSWTNKGYSFCGVMLDIDKFKTINDTYGHSEGDNALITVTNTLKECRNENEWVFRYAGDEFVILKMTHDKNGLDSYMAKVEKQLKEYSKANLDYNLSVSYGSCYFDYKTDVNSFIQEMDKNMYNMKEEHHSQREEGSNQ